MEYTMEPQAGGVILKGVLYQDGAPDDWFMPLPLLIRLGNNQEMRGSVQVKGQKSSFSIPLPTRAIAVLLDPDLYVLSEKTEAVRSGG
jgi:hypothetical protein